MSPALEGLPEKQAELMRLIASEPLFRIGIYDERLDRFSDDGDPDTINQLADAGLIRQVYDGDSDTGDLRITDAGRAILAKASPQ